MFLLSVSCSAVRVRKLSDFIKNILICVLKMKGLTGLELHESELLITEFLFVGEISLEGSYKVYTVGS